MMLNLLVIPSSVIVFPSSGNRKATISKAVSAGQNPPEYLYTYMSGKRTNNRRYYLHRRLKGVFVVLPRDREVRIPHTMADTLVDHRCYRYLRQLIELGYNIQTFIDEPMR